MSLYTALSQFLIYLRLHKGRSRKTQEQYAFHIWRFILWIVDDNTQKTLKKYKHIDFLPPEDINQRKNWHSPLLLVAKEFFEPKIEDIKKEDFDEWRLSLSDNGLSVKTTNAHIVTMRSWLKYLKKEEISCVDPTSLDLMKAHDREVTFLTLDEIKRFFEAIPRDTLVGKRDFAICACIYATGLRISELTALDREDINLETMEFGVR